MHKIEVKISLFARQTNVNGNPKVMVAYQLPRPLGSEINYKTVPNVRCYIFQIKYMI